MRLGLGLALAFVLGLRAPSLGAEPDLPAEHRVKQRASFQYERGPGAELCPDASVMRGLVGGHLGYDAFDDAAALQIRCRIIAQRPRLQAVVNVIDRASGRSGERKLASANVNCTELADAAALAIAIAIDPLLPPTRASIEKPSDENMAALPDDESSTPSRLPSVSDHANHQEEARPSREQRSVPLIFSIGAGAALSYALQPTPALAVNLAFAARRGALSVGLEGAWRPPSHLTFSGGTIAAQLLDATLLGCGHYGEMNACFVADGGVLVGSAEGYLRSAHDATPFVAAGFRAGWQPRLFGNGSVLIYVSGLVPLVRTTLWIDPASVWTMPRFAGQAGFVGFFSSP